mgnify:CR=1 FL=1
MSEGGGISGMDIERLAESQEGRSLLAHQRGHGGLGQVLLEGRQRKLFLLRGGFPGLPPGLVDEEVPGGLVEPRPAVFAHFCGFF